jgi:hypothetical protein
VTMDIIIGAVVLALLAAIVWHEWLTPTDPQFTIHGSHEGAAVAPSEPGTDPATLKSGEGRSDA